MTTLIRPWTGSVDLRREVSVVSPAPRDVWRQALAADPSALPSQTPEWTDWLCRTRGFTDASRLYEFADGRRLLLPLLARTAAGVRLTEESMPYGFGYGGPLVMGGEPSPDQARAVLDDLARRPVLRSSLAPLPRASAKWSAIAPPGVVRVPYLAHVLDLEGGFEQVRSTRFRSGAKRNIRRALKQPLEVRSGAGSGVVEAFAELNRRAVERWARQRGQPLWLARLVDRQRDRVGQLASAIDALGPMVRAWTAYLHGEPVAVNVALHFGAQAYGWLSAVDADLARRTQAGALLLSLELEEACASGVRWFQLGESDPGSGVAQYKELYGGVPVSWSALRFERLPMTAADHRLRAVAGRLASLGRGRAGAVDR
ncbi:GNAT family N-acetyltransferase [Geodermatophilus marinus]|uniref:GNAT family N-acetyltransferase n=1 Tax=Geodermatophilus sp. LHW52908 TaxID=2303986 RepID=UPI000E3CB0DE|nr:GNAT family N-acetyltransferase [Geodermatophilus sp. LHW52908]RFU22376.1 GNAT family N-acetyltransferase [Geodermatophilus sp. LHW52908]